MTDPKIVQPAVDASPTAQTTPDSLGLGRTSGQRGAEIIAGFRAEKYPSPETTALSRWSGRIVARLLMRLPASEASMNFLVARLHGLAELARRKLPPQGENAVFVEIGCGLSPRGLHLALEFPKLRVIEVDLPDVVRDKQQRLQSARNVTVPPNIEWRAADLGVTPLSEVLRDEQVDAVAAEGLNPYFSNQDVVRIARHIRESLKPDGIYVCDIPWSEGQGEEGKQVAGVFSKQAGVYKCSVNNEAEGRQLFLDAGYGRIILHQPLTLAQQLNLPQPLVQYSFFVEAHNTTEQPA